MKRAALYSALLHVALIGLLVANLENPFTSKKLTLQTISVDFVTIGDKTAAPKLSPEPESLASAPSSPQKQEKKPEPAPEQLPEELLKETSPPERDLPKEEKTKPEEKVKEKPKPDAVPLKKPKPKKKPKPIKKPPKAKPKPKTKKAYVNLEKKKKSKKMEKNAKKKIEQELNDILKDLDTDENSSTKEETASESDSSGAAADSLSSTITASVIDGVKNAIKPCWHNTSGRNDIVVTVDMMLTKDGHVKTAKCPDITSSDPHRRSAAEQAVAAVLDPKCQPLPLPPEKYESWKHISFEFDPKDMMR